MRLIVCDRCGETEPVYDGPVGEEYHMAEDFPREGWGMLTVLMHGTSELCPACVERALEKPERSPVLTATDMPDVPIVRGDHDTLNQLLQGKPAVCGHLGVKAGDVCACGVTVEDAEVFKAKV